MDPVFISLDVEKWERGHESIKITEVGISVLDTKNLQGLSLRDNANAWQSKIATRHLRIKNYSHKRFINKTFQVGCPENFLFGDSESVFLYQVAGILRGICIDAAKEGDRLRPVVFVGHAVHNDAKDLITIGVCRDNFKPRWR